MRRLNPLFAFAAVLLAVGLIASLAGCRVAGAIGDSFPPSEAYVDELHAAQDKAIADAQRSTAEQIAAATKQAEESVKALRTHTDEQDANLREHGDKQISQMRFDLTRAEEEGRKAYDKAKAEGKTEAEAIANGLLAKLDEQRKSSDTATATALSKAMEALNTGIERAKAAEAAAVEKAVAKVTEAEERQAKLREEQDKAIAAAKKKAEDAGGSDPLAIILGTLGIGTAGGGVLLAVRKAAKMIASYDASPFVGPNGETLTEGEIVKKLKSL